MSSITEVIIHGASDKEMDALNAWIFENDPERRQKFTRINMDAAGGTKWYTTDVWAAAFNYAPFGLIDRLRDPGTWGVHVLSVHILIDGEEQSHGFCFDGNEETGYRPVTEMSW